MPTTMKSSLLPATRIAALAAALCLSFGAAQAQFATVPAPQAEAATPAPSAAETAADYKRAVAQHVYRAYPTRVFKGKMPPLLYGVMMTETQLDADGTVLNVVVRRPPAAKEIGPWVVEMIKRAGPYPAPSRMGPTSVNEIWLVDKSGRFQVDTLTEGQL
jgi:periplasmic protein TonB